MVRSEPPPSRGRDTSGSEAASTVFYLAPLSLPPSLHFEGRYSSSTAVCAATICCHRPRLRSEPQL
uniref:Uncharacterized protein n=1 Tax=Zea mays TaxID=4577 RepID=B6T119_MAIZE|nr:hypothetical protein [Zea mays]